LKWTALGKSAWEIKRILGIAERGVGLAHTTIMRWIQRYVPEFEGDGIASLAKLDGHGE
jgi:hypothetical protein